MIRSISGCMLSLLISNQSTVGFVVVEAVAFAVSRMVSLKVV